MNDLQEALNRLLELQGWKYDDQIGLDDSDEEERKRLYVKVFDGLKQVKDNE